MKIFKLKGVNININRYLYVIIFLLLSLAFYRETAFNMKTKEIILTECYILTYVTIWYMLSKYTTLSQMYNGASIKLDGQDFFINKRKFNINNLSLIKLRYDIYAVNKKNKLLIFIFSKKKNRELFECLSSILSSEAYSTKILETNTIGWLDKLYCLSVGFVMIILYTI